MTFTAEQLLTIIGAIGVLVAALGAVIVNIIVALKTGQKADVLIHKTEEVANKVDQVHTLTNSNLSSVKAELTGTQNELKLLTQTIADLKSERQAAQVAAATAIAPAAPAGTARRTGDTVAPLPNPEPTPVKIVASESDPVPVADVHSKPKPKP